jgi:hypothetical protein
MHSVRGEHSNFRGDTGDNSENAPNSLKHCGEAVPMRPGDSVGDAGDSVSQVVPHVPPLPYLGATDAKIRAKESPLRRHTRGGRYSNPSSKIPGLIL